MSPVNLIFNHVHKCLGRKTILIDEHFSIHSGEISLLCGNNGVGKTTLLRIIAGLEKPGHAQVNLGPGTASWRRCRKQLQHICVYLHQQPYMLDGSVRKNLAYALPQRRLTAKERGDLIDEALELAQIGGIAERFAKTLSGGEQQRVALARAWLRQPLIMLLDEPVTNMDQESRIRTTNLLSQLKDQGMALFVASHDTEQFYTLADNTFTLQDGSLVSNRHSPFGANKLTTIQAA